jgi:predicted HTH transcriptional regulator
VVGSTLSEANPAATDQILASVPLTEAELLATEIAQLKTLTHSKRLMNWLLVKARATKQLLIRKKLDKIMALFNQHDKITSIQVEKILNVSYRTVGNYLNLLEKEGKIKQVGTTGRKVFYVKR